MDLILGSLLGFFAICGVALGATMATKYAALKARVHDSDALASRQMDVEALRCEVEKRKAIEVELRSAKEAAERASHSKSQFLANMSHELRTPLNAIIGFADLIAKELSGPVGTPIYKQYAGDIAAGGTQLFEILTNILDMARIEAGKGGVSDSEFSIAETIASAVRMCAGDQIAGKTVEIGCDDPAPCLRADERMIRQALVGLISNALKFSDTGGRVLVRVLVSADGGLDLYVSDSGAGIPADKHDLILEPFTQIQDVFTRRTGGLGLGLPLAKALVELHGGDLAIEQNGGQGTRVRLHLPYTRVIKTLSNAQLRAAS
jgi:signal transduction histidine kinase